MKLGLIEICQQTNKKQSAKGDQDFGNQMGIMHYS